ncbi:MAG: bifunctional pyr operon transcriptional regulator/uracil phosphoribosyltransferase PyrR [Verrucomicrobia bacterium]|nr:bifunctional pyr operon transcriptional regulator/uracil phosphoribosyltransferase PyrR [Verrucomicrobiota bacterium]
MPQHVTILDAAAMQRVLSRIAHEIAERNASPERLVMVGVQRGGIFLARRLAESLREIWGTAIPLGVLDVTMHRDDLDQRLVPRVHPTSMPFDITGKTVVLVDDVLFSGRTIRAALDALHDLGRPQSVQLAVLVDRGHRELPIQANFVGKDVPTSLKETVNVRLKEMDDEDVVTLEKPEP